MSASPAPANPLSASQAAFLELLVRRAALRFGEFTLKSGRKAPFFINTGSFNQGSDVLALGAAYAACIRQHHGDGVEVIFGPAYKGIPLALGASAAYQQQTGKPVGWAYNRKEAKDHGEGGLFVGAALAGKRVVIVDDVITAGTALRESLDLLKPTGAQVLGAIVSVDRQERLADGRTAVQAMQADTDLRVDAVLGIRSAVAHLLTHPIDGKLALSGEDAARINAYLDGQGKA